MSLNINKNSSQARQSSTGESLAVGNKVSVNNIKQNSNTGGKNISADKLTISTTSTTTLSDQASFNKKRRVLSRDVSRSDSAAATEPVADKSRNITADRGSSLVPVENELATLRLPTRTIPTTLAPSTAAVSTILTSPPSLSGTTATAAAGAINNSGLATSPSGNSTSGTTTGVAKNKRRRYDLKLDLNSAQRSAAGGNVVIAPASSAADVSYILTQNQPLTATTLLRPLLSSSGLPTTFVTNSGNTFSVTPNAQTFAGATIVSPLGGIPVVLNSPDLDKFTLSSPQIERFIRLSELPTPNAFRPTLQQILLSGANFNNTSAFGHNSIHSQGNTAGGVIAVKQERATFIAPTAYLPLNAGGDKAREGEHFAKGFEVELDKLHQKDQQHQQTATMVGNTSSLNQSQLSFLTSGSNSNSMHPSTPTMLYLPAGAVVIQQQNSLSGSVVNQNLSGGNSSGSGPTMLMPVYSTIQSVMPAATALSSFNTMAGSNHVYLHNVGSESDLAVVGQTPLVSSKASTSGAGGRTKKSASSTQLQQKPKKTGTAGRASAKKNGKSAVNNSTKLNTLQLPQQQVAISSRNSGCSDTTSETSSLTGYDDENEFMSGDGTKPSQTGGANSTTGVPGDRVERKRERNRLAAAKCRARKIERIAELEQKVQEINDCNRKLEDQRDQLHDEVELLKRRIQEHVHAGCAIERYADASS